MAAMVCVYSTLYIGRWFLQINTLRALSLYFTQFVSAKSLVRRKAARAYAARALAHNVIEMKAKQSSKIRKIGEALIAAGFRALDEQADALGLSRSTTWTILKGNHKNSGLSAATIRADSGHLEA
jgi:hypothetical protein